MLDLAHLLLYGLPDLRLHHAFEEEQRITFILVSHATQSVCPDCHRSSTRVHSRYTRTLADLPWAGRALRLEVQVRRFFCPSSNAECSRLTFTERLPDLAEHYARRTTRLGKVLRQIGFALGGEAGVRLTQEWGLGIHTSPDTLLRLLRHTPVVDAPTPRVLGVDDWAIRKGHTYGTILCDLERGCPIELLADRSAGTLAQWLRQHPGVEIISRDRGGAYADGASQGAPNAVQVADRWHLMKNIGDALQNVVARFYPKMRKALLVANAQTHGAEIVTATNANATTATTTETIDATTEITNVPVDAAESAFSSAITLMSTTSVTKSELLSQERRARRMARYQEVRVLHSQGWGIREIARKLGFARNTVKRFVRADAFPEYQKHPHRPSKLDQHKGYIRERWQHGCRNASQIWRELAERQGYTGGRGQVRNFVNGLRREYGVPARRWKRELTAKSTRGCALQETTSDTGAGGGATGLASKELRVRQLRWLLALPIDTLSEKECELVRVICEVSKEVTFAHGLVQDFNTIVRKQQREHLSSWISIALESEVRELVAFARGLQRDYRAVAAALELPWSNGPVEGQITKLKLLKRQMYGRANFDLLRLRVLHAA